MNQHSFRGFLRWKCCICVRCSSFERIFCPHLPTSTDFQYLLMLCQCDKKESCGNIIEEGRFCPNNSFKALQVICLTSESLRCKNNHTSDKSLISPCTMSLVIHTNKISVHVCRKKHMEECFGCLFTRTESSPNKTVVPSYFSY